MPIIYKPRTRLNATNCIQSAITVADPPSGCGGQPHTMASQHYQSHSCVPAVCTGFHRVQKIKTAEPFLRDCGLHRASRQIKTASKGIIRKECQSFTNHVHDKTPPTVFIPLSLWLTLPRNMGGSHTLWPPSITRAILACPWFAQGFTGYKKSKQQSHS